VILSRVLMVLGVLIAIASLIVPVVQFFMAHKWLISLAIGLCLLGMGASLAISEAGLVGLFISTFPMDLSLLDAAIYMRELNRTARDPQRAAKLGRPADASASPVATPRLFHAIAWLHQLSHLAALCLVHESDDALRDLIADSDADFFEFSCAPLVAALPPAMQQLAVGRAGVARAAARQACLAQEVPLASDAGDTNTAAAAASPPEPTTAASDDAVLSLLHDNSSMQVDDLNTLDELAGGQAMAVLRRRRQLQHETTCELALQTPRTRRSMLHRLSQRRISVTNQRRVIIYGKLALMPLRMAITQAQPIVPYAVASVKETRLYVWAASWASYAYMVIAKVLGHPWSCGGSADGDRGSHGLGRTGTGK